MALSPSVRRYVAQKARERCRREEVPFGVAVRIESRRARREVRYHARAPGRRFKA